MSDIRYNKSIVKNINESLIRKALRSCEVFTKTKIARDTGLSFPTVSRILDEMAQENCLGRNGTPEDVAKAIEYLSSAEFVTGQVLPVNGGYII